MGARIIFWNYTTAENAVAFDDGETRFSKTHICIFSFLMKNCSAGATVK